MFTQFFGSYLLSKKFITPSQLVDVLDYQKTVHLKLGVMAVNAGYMSADQVNDIHATQTRVDKKFGELAIEKGYIDEDKLTELLYTQGSGYLQLGQALVDKKYMTLNQFEESLNSYKKDYLLTDEAFNALRSGDVDQVVNLYCDFSNASYNDIYKGYVSLLFRTFIRFLEKDFKLVKIEPIKKYDFEVMASQEITGEISFYTCIASNEKTFVDIGGHFAMKSYNNSNSYSRESVGEFLNMINGLYLVNMSEVDIELGLAPQMIKEKKSLVELFESYCMTVEVSSGQIDFIISKMTPKVI